jgi:thiamine biosynthesis lipoprotein ApbE
MGYIEGIGHSDKYLSNKYPELSPTNQVSEGKDKTHIEFDPLTDRPMTCPGSRAQANLAMVARKIMNAETLADATFILDTFRLEQLVKEKKCQK